MGRNTAIAWADDTWNPVHGCTKVSPACEHCYALAMAWRHVNNPKSPFYRSGTAEKRGGKVVWTGKIAVNENALTQPLRWRKPRRIFVNSMSDLFHENMPVEIIDRCFAVMALAPQHTFLVLTKRPERMREYCLSRNGMGNADICRAINEIPNALGNRHGALSMPLHNIWLGVTAEDQPRADERLPILMDIPAAKYFASHEPALGPVDWTRVCLVPQVPGSARAGIHINTLTGHYVESGQPYVGEWDVEGPCPPANERRRLDQVITGGESGPGARPMHPDWARQDRDQCRAAGVAFFMKQMGANPFWDRDETRLFLKHRAGADPSEWPADLRVQEFPGMNHLTRDEQILVIAVLMTARHGYLMAGRIRDVHAFDGIIGKLLTGTSLTEDVVRRECNERPRRPVSFTTDAGIERDAR